jgi:RHS repeat-associated protein
MKIKVITIIITLLSIGFLHSQSNDQNYVKTTVYKDGFMGSAVDNATSDQMIETVEYFDGLGRPIQTVGVKQGGNGRDILTHIDYDPFGRQVKEYLPVISTANNGNFEVKNESSIQTYYHSKYPGEWGNSSSANPFSEKEFENSPLNRVLKQAAPGESWKSGSRHEIEFGYATNTSTEVRYYYVTTTYANNTYTPTLKGGTSYYAVNTLYKNITYDENHTSGTAHSTEEFKDKQGRVILKRTYGSVDLNGDGDTIDSGEANATHDTYYVYDDFGNLTYVLPPKSEPHGGIPNAAELAELCYQYKYDHRNRLVEKKIPGKDWEYIVYDNLDRPVLTQDAGLRASKKWLFTKYDALGRVAYTGIYTHSASVDRESMQSLLYTNRTSEASHYEEKTGSGDYYSNSDFPTANCEKLTLNYYDNYTFNRAGAGTTATSFNVQSNTNVKGLPTGSRTKVLGTTSWITNVIYYDSHLRPIYNYTKNDYLGTTDMVEIKLLQDGNSNDIRGLTHETKTTHKKTGKTDIVSTDKFTYDHSGKLLTQTQKIGSQPEELIVLNEYDDLGQLKSKKVGGDVATVIGNSIGLQTVDYTYNIRGWLKSINMDTNNDNDLFDFTINYNTVNHSGTKLYNGNISETEWKTQNDNVLRWYRYGYDALNRITSATDNTSDKRYSLTNVTYDKNGNIAKLKRNGHRNAGFTSFGIMDDLTYTYQPTSNKLLKVADAASIDQFGFKDDAVNTAGDTADDYSYDANGNMKTDTNKGITNISYNHLNLPTVVTINGQNISYFYDATGVKLRKTVNGINTDYAGNYIYESNQLQFFNTPEGYAEPIDVANYNAGFRYTYQYKDHLGNIRLSYTDINQNIGAINLEIIEENNYYPFGLKHMGYNGNITGRHHKYMFGAKELQDEIVGSSSFEVYDFGARNYDPALGRWMNIDPLAEKYTDYSTYIYAINNPVFFIDPDGQRIDVSDILKLKKDENGKDIQGEYENAELAEAFLIFANSEVGIEFLSQFAEAGQKIGNHLYEKSGDFHEQSIDISFSSSPLNNTVSEDSDVRGSRGKNAMTASSNNQNEMKIGVFINENINYNNIYASDFAKNKKDPMKRLLYVLSRTSSIFHESLIHAQGLAEDFTDGNCNLDYNPKYDEGKKDHDKAYKPGSLFYKKGIPAVQQIYNMFNSGISDSKIKDMILKSKH